MALQIGFNIEQIKKRILGDPASGIQPDLTLAIDIATAARKAIFSGIGKMVNDVVTQETDDWKKLMEHFAAGDTKALERLCGKDASFMGTEWGKECLVYIAGDATCTSETTMETGTKRSMILVDQIADRLGKPRRRMLELLDAEEGDLQTIDAQVVAADANFKKLEMRAKPLENTDTSVTGTLNKQENQEDTDSYMVNTTNAQNK